MDSIYIYNNYEITLKKIILPESKNQITFLDFLLNIYLI